MRVLFPEAVALVEPLRQGFARINSSAVAAARAPAGRSRSARTLPAAPSNGRVRVIECPALVALLDRAIVSALPAVQADRPPDLAALHRR